jgi:hypothetical protein
MNNMANIDKIWLIISLEFLLNQRRRKYVFDREEIWRRRRLSRTL